MPKFMILYRSEMDASEAMGGAPEEMEASMKEWMVWGEEAAKMISFEFGLPLLPRHHFGADAPASDVSGYSTIEADDKDTVHELMENHPHLKMEGNSIDVLEMIPMPGM